MIVTILTAGILGGTVIVVWWVLRDESNPARLMVAALVASALALRLMYPTDYPAGYNPDEIQHCRSAAYPRSLDEPILPTAAGSPALSPALFCVPLLPYVSPRLAIRGSSIVAGSLSVALFFALCRAMQLDITASLTTAAVIAVLPWSLFYGRLSVSGELPFTEGILLTMLARLIWRPVAGWREMLAGAGAVAFALYNYWSAAVLLGVPLALIPLIPTWRRRACCVGLTLLAGLAWVPWWRLSAYQWAMWHVVTGVPDPHIPPTYSLAPGLRTSPLTVLGSRLWLFLQCLVEPKAEFYIWTQPAVMIHPPIVLIAAAFGLLWTTWRRKYFLLASAGIGAVPALISYSGDTVNGHRALLALPLVSVAAGCGIHCVPWRTVRVVIAAGVVVLAAVQSTLFFSPAFWPRPLDAFPIPR